MPQTCKSCSRANPDDAVYCHHDGSILPAHQHAALSLKTALRPFLSPLVFPSGRVCVNFDQMQRACQEEWSAAVDLLRYGQLEPFFIQQGRADLAFAARAAAEQPDPEQALDDLIARLPSQAPLVPRLEVTPLEVFVEGGRVGEDRLFTLRLVNQGARLVCGTVTSDNLWLSFGDRAASQKTFRFPQAQAITVHILGKHLHAGEQPLEGKLEVVSNAGEYTVTVRVEVPVTPFPHGLLAGARTPRHIVDRVQAIPTETVAWFENGAVASWYAQNGWTYPVQGPSAAGLDAVRQFFAALGLPDPVPPPPPKPPPVAIPLSQQPAAFDHGVLAGVRTPRELVERTRTAPAEAATLFEDGAVAAWYACNGWTYPVQGPTALGLDAVRQFFGALGLSDPIGAGPVGPQPFPHGPLAGARTPQELVERARAAPVESAGWFESGAVAGWYARNGWTYPIQGPAALGLESLQQYFRALGLPDPLSAPPPPANPSARVAAPGVRLQGSVGESLRHRFETKVRLKQGRLQTATATCDQTWLDVRDTKVDGDATSLILVVSAVPNRPGETLDAQVSVTLNDAHRFIIPVTLAVGPPSAGD